MKFRAVFIDYGGVIQRTEFQSPRQRLAQRFGMEFDDLDKLVFASPSAAEASQGRISEAEHWREVARRLKIPGDEIELFENEFFAGDIIDHAILGYLRSLRPRIKTGLISNAWSGMRGYLVRQKVDDAFDCISISAEVGAAKPDAKIYLHALDQAQVGASEAVFVDDVLENIEACERVGMKGILFRESRETIERLKALLKE